MACCILTAYFISKLLRASEYLHIPILKPEYNAFHDGPAETLPQLKSTTPIALTTTKILLTGLTCAACTTAVSNAVTALPGVERITVSLPLSRATVVHQSDLVGVEEIVKAIEESGYGAGAGERSAQETLELLRGDSERGGLKTAFEHAAVVASVAAGLEWAVRWIPSLPTMVRRAGLLGVGGLAIWIQLVDAWVLHHAAWSRGWRARLTMDSLVSLSLLLGMGLSGFNLVLFGLDDAKVYWSSISFLTTVILGSRLLDLVLRKQSTATFTQLYELQDKAMHVQLIRSPSKPDLDTSVVDAATLAPNDEILIKPGAIVPCDCYVMDGETLIDQATMTGEPLPARKKAGDQVMAGTTNLSHQVRAVVSRAQEDSALESLIASISTATETSTSNKEVDTMISNFAAGIILLTMLSFCKTLVMNWSEGGIYLALNFACERAMAVLASACPCALGLAKPTAIMAGLNAAQQRGVVIKGGFDSFSSLSHLTHVVLDKTGTLTTGKLSVSGTSMKMSDLHRTLLCVAERDSHGHPVADAVFQWAFQSLTVENRRMVSEAVVRKCENEKGNGVACEVRLQSQCHWDAVHIGNEEYFAQLNISLCPGRREASHERTQTLVHLAINGKHVSSLDLQDTVRPDARAVISHLKDSLGLSVSMLTGDTATEATRVSKELGVPVLSSHATPLSKQAYIKDIRERSSHNRVAMVGDGLNDTPALATANIGIALNISSRRTVASATTAEVGDVILTSPHLSRLPELLEIAWRTTAQAKFNLWWAVGYNVLAVSLAMGLWEASLGITLDVSKAGTAMALSSLSVIGWGMLLRWRLGQLSFDRLQDQGKA